MKEEAEKVAASAREVAESIFGVSDVEIIVEVNPEFVIPQTGAGGFTPSSHSVFIYIDPENINLQQNLEREIRSTVTHEYHHAVRNRAINWEKDSLLGAMITEGLADHFDIEVNGGGPRPWSVALSGMQLEEFEIRARPIFDSRDSNNNAWLLGSETEGLPKWGGYSLGFKLVGDYLTKTGKKTYQLVAEPPTIFI
ncbi:MAG TPA: DUF2268 domain-containing putative Zn-dependent protease [Candidatus Paceibacterota bacterium]|nr:DUF2268 domain-containing putative Zn-dependent protease [Candidatus Paceibacterota bacterium]